MPDGDALVSPELDAGLAAGCSGFALSPRRIFIIQSSPKSRHDECRFMPAALRRRRLTPAGFGADAAGQVIATLVFNTRPTIDTLDAHTSAKGRRLSISCLRRADCRRWQAASCVKRCAQDAISLSSIRDGRYGGYACAIYFASTTHIAMKAHDARRPAR